MRQLASWSLKLPSGCSPCLTLNPSEPVQSFFSLPPPAFVNFVKLLTHSPVKLSRAFIRCGYLLDLHKILKAVHCTRWQRYLTIEISWPPIGHGQIFDHEIVPEQIRMRSLLSFHCLASTPMHWHNIQCAVLRFVPFSVRMKRNKWARDVGSSSSKTWVNSTFVCGRLYSYSCSGWHDSTEPLVHICRLCFWYRWLSIQGVEW